MKACPCYSTTTAESTEIILFLSLISASIWQVTKIKIKLKHLDYEAGLTYKAKMFTHTQKEKKVEHLKRRKWKIPYHKKIIASKVFRVTIQLHSFKYKASSKSQTNFSKNSRDVQLVDRSTIILHCRLHSQIIVNIQTQ